MISSTKIKRGTVYAAPVSVTETGSNTSIVAEKVERRPKKKNTTGKWLPFKGHQLPGAISIEYLMMVPVNICGLLKLTFLLGLIMESLRTKTEK